MPSPTGCSRSVTFCTEVVPRVLQPAQHRLERVVDRGAAVDASSNVRSSGAGGGAIP